MLVEVAVNAVEAGENQKQLPWPQELGQTEAGADESNQRYRQRQSRI